MGINYFSTVFTMKRAYVQNQYEEEKRPIKLIRLDESISEADVDRPCKHTRSINKEKTYIDEDAEDTGDIAATELAVSALQELDVVRAIPNTINKHPPSWSPKENDIVEILWNIEPHKEAWFTGTLLCVLPNGKYIVKYAEREVYEEDFNAQEWRLVTRPEPVEKKSAATVPLQLICSICEELKRDDIYHDQTICQFYKERLLMQKQNLEKQLVEFTTEISKTMDNKKNLLTRTTSGSIEYDIKKLQDQTKTIETFKNKAIEEYRKHVEEYENKMKKLKLQQNIIIHKIEECNSMNDQYKAFDAKIAEQQNGLIPIQQQIEKISIKIKLFEIEQEKSRLIQMEKDLL